MIAKKPTETNASSLMVAKLFRETAFFGGEKRRTKKVYMEDASGFRTKCGAERRRRSPNARP